MTLRGVARIFVGLAGLRRNRIAAGSIFITSAILPYIEPMALDRIGDGGSHHIDNIASTLYISKGLSAVFWRHWQYYPPTRGEKTKMSSEVYERIRSNPKFDELVGKRSRFAWLLTAVVLGIYFIFNVSSG